jgi:hypothetical protein
MTESSPESSAYTGRDVLYREGAVGFFDVQRAADALLRQGRKPSVAGIREQLGGGSPNTITPLLARYWQKLGERLAEGPESLERVPEALARVTELLWRRALEEARERLKLLQQPDQKPGALEELQEQIGKLSVALAEAKAREHEQVQHIASLLRDRSDWSQERKSILAVLKGTQALLGQKASKFPAAKPAGQLAANRQRKASRNTRQIRKRRAPQRRQRQKRK